MKKLIALLLTLVMLSGTIACAVNEESILDNLVMGDMFVPSSLTPFRNGTQQHHPIFRYMYDRLAFLTPDAYVPQAAKSWTAADDGKTWTVEIYDYILDAKGNHITTDDIIWFMEEYRINNYKPCFAQIESIEKIDDYTFTVVMKNNIKDMFETCLISTFIISRKAYEESENGFASDIVSTSPYSVTKFIPDSSISFTLREDYWQKKELIAPCLETNVKNFTIQNIQEGSQQQVALETGSVDVFMGLNAEVADAFIESNDYTVSLSASTAGNGLYFSGAETSVVGDDVNLRKAICHAIDAQAIINLTADGYGEVMHSIIPRTNIGYPAKWDTNNDYYVYDVELAKQYLEKSDYNGEPISILLSPTQQRLGVVMKAYLEQVGINLELNIVDMALYAALAFDGRNYDLNVIPVGNGVINLLNNRFNMDAYEFGDVQARKDETLRELLHNTYLTTNFNEENLDAINNYIDDNCYAYGLYLPMAVSVARSNVPIAEICDIENGTGVDYIACRYAP